MACKCKMITGPWLCYNTYCLVSVDFRLGTTRVGLPRLRMPPTMNITIVAVVPYDFQFALLWDSQTLRDWRVIYFSCCMI